MPLFLGEDNKQAMWLVLLVGYTIGCALAAMGRDAIVSLPGWDGPLPSAMYSGYLNAGSSRLFYWFVAVEGELSTSAPLTVWFNGGPGFVNVCVAHLSPAPSNSP